MKRYVGAARLYLLVVNLVLVMSLVSSLIPTDDVLVYYTLNALLVTILSIYVPAVVYTRKASPPEFGTRRISFAQGALAVAIGICTYTAMAGLLDVVYGLLPPVNELSEATEASLPALEQLMCFFILAILGPIAEERLFRGSMMFSWLAMGRIKVVLLTAILFALLHMNPLSLPSLFFAGIVLGLVAYDSRSVYPAIIVHVVINSISLIADIDIAIFQNPILNGVSLFLLSLAAILALYVPFKKLGFRAPGSLNPDELKNLTREKLRERGYTPEDLPDLLPSSSLRNSLIVPPLVLAVTVLIYLNLSAGMVMFGVME